MDASSSSSDAIVVTLTPDEVRMGKGADPAQLLVKIRNAGSVADAYTLEVKGLDPAWYAIGDQGRKLALFPGDSLSCPVELHPFQTGDVAPGLYPFDVLVRSESD